MRILLINPFYPFSEHPTPPLGLMYLAGSLESAGHEVRILDLLATPESYSPLYEQLENFHPRVVGTTAVTMNFSTAADILRDCKRIDPEIITVIGGPHVTFTHEDTLSNHPYIDLIALGEGEETLAELVSALELKQDINSIAGLALRHNGDIIYTGKRPLIKDLNSLPLPSHSLIPVSKYRALQTAFPILSGRGCPGKCIFCVGQKMIGAQGRFRRADLVVEEIERILALGFNQINFADDLFTYRKNHVQSVCREIRQKKLDFSWSAFARVDTVDEWILDEMRSAGCSFLCFGVESANEDILKRIKKRIKLDQVEKAIKLCRIKGIEAFASFILGLPGETQASIEQTVRFAEKLETYYGFHLLTPFPGTEVREYATEYGLTILTNDWSQYDADSMIVQGNDISQKDISGVLENYNNRVDGYICYLETTSPLSGIHLKEREKLEKTQSKRFVWELLLSNMIDRVETQAETQDYKQHLDQLITKLQAKLQYSGEYIQSHIEKLVAQKLIKTRISGERVRWVWS